MAHGRPWYQRNGGDFLMATIGFPDIETRWVYSAIIDMLNDRDRPIADEPGFICGFTGLSRKKWAIARAYLVERGYLVATDDGHLTNPRFEREHEAREVKREANAQNGSKGGKKAAANRARQGDLPLEKNAESTPNSRGESTPESTPNSPYKGPAMQDIEPAKNNDLAVANAIGSRAREPASEARGESKEEENGKQPANPTTARSAVAARSIDPPISRDDLLSIVAGIARAGGVLLRPDRTTSYLKHNVDIVKGWIADGIDIEHTALPAIARFVARMDPDETCGSIKLFDGSVRKAQALIGSAEPDAPVDPERRIASQRQTAALYRRMGRISEAEEIEAALPPSDPP